MSVRFIGQEFLVNTTTANNQREPSITGLPDRRFVVTGIPRTG